VDMDGHSIGIDSNTNAPSARIAYPMILGPGFRYCDKLTANYLTSGVANAGPVSPHSLAAPVAGCR